MTIVYSSHLQNKSVTVLSDTTTSQDQMNTERECAPYLVDIARLPESQKAHLRATGHLQNEDDNTVGLLTNLHIQYLQSIWERKLLRASFVSLDSSRPWIIYWCLQALDLLGSTSLPDESSVSPPVIIVKEQNNKNGSSSRCTDADAISAVDRTVEALKLCWNQNTGGFGGGFGGGLGQLPHAATTYAAVLVLCILASNHGSTKALDYLKEIRLDLYTWFHQTLIDPTTGTVRMHDDGEIDVRASYCVVAVSKLLNLEVTNVIVDFCKRCQTWEGGFGGEPGNEAHGGYTFCALATLYLMDAVDQIDVEALRSWLVRRQLSYEGGFSGRTNKLVDGCYSFWQGGALALLDEDYDYPMLERYVLLCGQDVHGGLRDKPSKGRDFYHSCYCLSGLSVAVHRSKKHFGSAKIKATHAAMNIQPRHVDFIKAQFADTPIGSTSIHKAHA